MNNLNELKMHDFNDLKSILLILGLFQKFDKILELLIINYFYFKFN
jgi:hypothetical protein